MRNVNDYFWYAVYTNPRAEKKTAALLAQRGIEVYLPLQKKLQKWSDRKKWVELPLFSSYLFVKISEKEYLEVLNTPGAVRYITFSGKAAKIYDHEIETIRLLLSTGEDLEVQSYQLQKGQTVKVIAGNFMGLQGRIAGTQNNKRFIVDFQQLGQSIMLNIPSTYLEPVF